MIAETDPQVDTPPVVVGFDRTTSGVENLQRWTELARRTLVGEAVTVGQLDLIFVDAEEMAELNLAHMGHEGPTDVLSFPLDVDEDGLDFGGLDAGNPPPGFGDHDGAVPGSTPPILLGDVVVCPAVAELQAPEHCGRLEAEMSLLVVHGVLHILGHDHAEPDETALMHSRERHYLGELGFSHPEPI